MIALSNDVCRYHTVVKKIGLDVQNRDAVGAVISGNSRGGGAPPSGFIGDQSYNFLKSLDGTYIVG